MVRNNSVFFKAMMIAKKKCPPWAKCCFFKSFSSHDDYEKITVVIITEYWCKYTKSNFLWFWFQEQKAGDEKKVGFIMDNGSSHLMLGCCVSSNQKEIYSKMLGFLSFLFFFFFLFYITHSWKPSVIRALLAHVNKSDCSKLYAKMHIGMDGCFLSVWAKASENQCAGDFLPPPNTN